MSKGKKISTRGRILKDLTLYLVIYNIKCRIWAEQKSELQGIRDRRNWFRIH